MVELTFKRTEMKYLLDDEQRGRLMSLMMDDGRMVGDEWGPSTIRNVYYDTVSDLLIRRSLEHPLYKEKVRMRTYGAWGDEVFVELKKKYDGVVYKRRARMEAGAAYALLAGKGSPTTQIEREIDFTARRYGGLVPRMYIAYEREAFFASDDHDFRMTFDCGVRCSWEAPKLPAPGDVTMILPRGRNILEVKSPKAMPLWLVRFLDSERLFKTSFSKYGCAYQLRRSSERHAASSLLADANPIQRADALRHMPAIAC